MPPSSLPRLVAVTLVLAVAYFLLAEAGLLLALPSGYATLVYPPAGLAFAACVLWGGWRAAQADFVDRHKAVLRMAKILVGRHFQTIDRVAAIVLLEGRNGAMRWGAEHHGWLLNEIRKVDAHRRQIGRRTYVKRPAWLAASARVSDDVYAALRADLLRLRLRQRSAPATPGSNVFRSPRPVPYLALCA